MTEDTIRPVNIDNRLVGLKGLDEAIRHVQQAGMDQNEEKIADFLLNEISKQNYVPNSARSAYRLALLREYNIAMNIPVADEPVSGMSIWVLGMGCARCDQLLSDLRDVLSELQITADLRHLTDPEELSRFGAMGAPALVINSNLVSVGVIPPKTSLRRWIMEAFGA